MGISINSLGGEELRKPFPPKLFYIVRYRIKIVLFLDGFFKDKMATQTKTVSITLVLYYFIV